MATGIIKIFDREKRCGCVQDDRDQRVHFFHRACIASDYSPRKGDRIAFNQRANLRGRLEAYEIYMLAAAR
jgi:cold shock CspA family protein